MEEVCVLIVEDEEGIRELIQLFLQKEGYQVLTAEDGAEALAIVEEKRPDLILLDIEMPGMDGFEVCQQIRQQSKTPILFVSCRKELSAKIQGLSIGADDYITKPFNFRELAVRIKAVLRRSEWGDEEQATFRFGEFQMDLDRCELTVRDEKIELSNKEFQLLALMVSQPNRVWSAEQLYNQVWGYYADGSPQTVKVHISNLRQKLENEPTTPRYIQTVRGFGYKFVSSFN